MTFSLSGFTNQDFEPRKGKTSEMCHFELLGIPFNPNGILKDSLQCDELAESLWKRRELVRADPKLLQCYKLAETLRQTGELVMPQKQTKQPTENAEVLRQHVQLTVVKLEPPQFGSPGVPEQALQITRAVPHDGLSINPLFVAQRACSIGQAPVQDGVSINPLNVAQRRCSIGQAPVSHFV